MLAPCGTITAYQRHKRRQEPVDEACAQAARDQKNKRVAAKRDDLASVVRLSIAETPPPEAPLDELSKLRWNLSILEATMSAGVPTGMAALSKQHADLVAAIARLEKANRPEMSVFDQLRQRREDRIAKTAH